MYVQVARRIVSGVETHRTGHAGHFDVLVSAAPPSRPLYTEAENRCIGTAVSASREYLRVYYGDYLGVSPAQKPRFADIAETTLDCEDWLEWIRHATPRTRLDAYPLLLVCKDLLDRFVRRELRLVSRRTSELEAELMRARSDIAAQACELDTLRNRLGPDSDIHQV